MEAIVFTLRLNSLYSIRIPFTWQSALTYPVPPPSSVIGLIANAVQRYKNDKHPNIYLQEIQDKIVWAGSKLLTPCIIKSYITSAITKFKDTYPGSKFTNALGRQYAYTKEIKILVIFEGEVDEDIIKALKFSPITAGDSESLVSLLEEPRVYSVRIDKPSDIFETQYYFDFEKYANLVENGTGKIFLMHKKCFEERNNLPLYTMMCPLKEANGILKPTSIKLRNENNENIYYVESEGFILPL